MTQTMERVETRPARTIERVEAHYEIQELSGGKAFKWCPECALVECGCGEKVTVAAFTEPCPCGEDYAEVIRELAELRPREEELRAALLEDYYEWKAESVDSYDDIYGLELRALE